MLQAFVQKTETENRMTTSLMITDKTYSVSKQFGFEAAHILERSEGTSCACSDTVHGHSYKFQIEIEVDQLNKEQMVMDFSAIGVIGNSWVDLWDHALLIPTTRHSEFGAFPGKKAQYTQFNPTAERMAEIVADSVVKNLPGFVTIVQRAVRSVTVRVWETEKCFATCRMSLKSIS